MSVPETVTLVSAVNGVDGITINWKAANGAKTQVLIMKYLKFKMIRPIQIATKLALSLAEVTAKN